MIGWAECRREPFRFLFPLGVSCGLLGVGHWLLFVLNVTPTSSGFYHASIQVQAYMACFIAGFLMTAVPRFAGAASASTSELVGVLCFVFAQPILLSLGHWVGAELCFAGLLLTLACFAGRRFARRGAGVGPPPEFVWILIAILHGLVGTLLLVLGQVWPMPAWVLLTARPMVQQGFLLGIVLGVGGFMAPRLMGRAFRPVSLGELHPDQVRHLRRRRIALHGLAGAGLLASFIVEGMGVIQAAYLLRAAVVTGELAWTTQWYLPPRVTALYVRLLWVSVWMVQLGFWGAGIWPAHRVGLLHLTFIGGFSLMTFAVGTMVVLSHAGAAARLTRPLWVLWIVAAGVGLAIVGRVAADWLPSLYQRLIGIAACGWLAAAAAWLAFVLSWILQAVAPGTFERLHDEAKRKLQDVTPPAAR